MDVVFVSMEFANCDAETVKVVHSVGTIEENLNAGNVTEIYSVSINKESITVFNVKGVSSVHIIKEKLDVPNVKIRRRIYRNLWTQFRQNWGLRIRLLARHRRLWFTVRRILNHYLILT